MVKLHLPASLAARQGHRRLSPHRWPVMQVCEHLLHTPFPFPLSGAHGDPVSTEQTTAVAYWGAEKHAGSIWLPKDLPGAELPPS